MNRGFSKHADSKQHLACYKHSKMGKKIISLVNTEAIERNRYYFSALIVIVGFWLLINWRSEEKLTNLKAKNLKANKKEEITLFKSV